MAPSLRSSAKVPRRAARLATTRIEQSSLKYKLLIRQSQWPSGGDLSSPRGVSQPSNLQPASEKLPRLADDTSARRVPKAGGSHLENSDDVDRPAQSSRKPKSQESPDSVPRQPVLQSDTKDSDDVDRLAQSRNAKLQKSRDTVPKKPVFKSDTEDSDDVDDPTHSKKTKLQKSHHRGPQKPVLKSANEDSDDVDDPTYSNKTNLLNSHDRGPRKTVLKSDTEDSDDTDNPTDSKKTKLQKSRDMVVKKPVLKSGIENSDDADDPTRSKKTKLQKSRARGPRQPVLKSDTEDSDGVDDPTYSRNVKSAESAGQKLRKPTLRSNDRSYPNMQLKQPRKKVDLKRSSRLAGKLKEPQNACLQCEDSLGETAKTRKRRCETFKPTSSRSGITQQADRQVRVPAGTWRNTAVTSSGMLRFREPDSMASSSQYKCSVTGCPHTNTKDHIGFWLFPVPDEKDEASLHSAWLQSVPVDVNINRPLSPRVCFKHFDEKKDFVSMCKRYIGLKPCAVPSRVPRQRHQSQSMTAAEAAPETTISTEVGRGSQSTIGTDGENKLESATVVATDHGSRSTTSTGKQQESEPMSIVSTAQESQTTTAASMDSESQCTNAITSAPELESDSNSKSAAESGPTFQASSAQLMEENSGAGQQNEDDVCASPVSVSRESLEEAAKHCPTVVAESLLHTEDTNAGTCEPPTSEIDSEKCASESVSMQATNSSNKLEEQKRDSACSLVTHDPVNDAGSTAVSHCASPEGSPDSDVDADGLPKCVPNEMCGALTQPVLVTDNEGQHAMLSKLEIDLEASPQASSVSAQICSTNKLVDASNDRMDKEEIKVATERHNLDPPPHAESNHKSDASITAIRTAAKVHPTLDAPTMPLLRKEVTVTNVAMLNRGPSNLVHFSNSETKRNKQDGIFKSGLPNFSSQSYGCDQRDERHVSSHAFNVPFVKPTVDGKSRPNVSKEPSASCSAIVRHHPDLPGGSSIYEAETRKPTNPGTASHLFDPSQGRYILKKEVLQDGDELGMSAVLCTVVWVPTGGANP